jgi:signal transduction histidine kinase
VLGPRLLRTSAFRLTLISVALFSSAAVVLLAIINLTTAGFMARQLDRDISEEVAALQDVARLGGANALAVAIAEREAARPRTGSYYLLQDRDGERLAGDLRVSRPAESWFDIDGGARPHRIRARGIRLGDGDFLVVGQDADQLDRVKGLIVEAFLWSAAVTVALAMAGGMLFSASLLRRIAVVTRTSQAIMAGDLSQRIPVLDGGDEFDQLARVLNAMLARIEDLMAGLRQVTNDVAHDLRTPLSRLRQRLEAVQRGGPGVEAYERLIDRSVQELDAILETFAAMLRIAEIEAASRAIAFAPLDLSALLGTVAEVYEPLAAEKGQALECRIAPRLAVQGDRSMLTQMMANLVQNALSHTPPGTRIAVEAAAIAGGVEVTVADTGPGIPATERDKVFRRFYRLESSRTTPGSGLGLSLAAAIAGLHRIGIVLEDNRPGLRVVLRFPPVAT